MKQPWLIAVLAVLAAGCAKGSDPQPPAAIDRPGDARAGNLQPVEVQPAAVEHDGYGSGRTLFGTPLGQARTVVFISDCSGSMTDSIDFMKYELKRCIDRLRPEDKFDVLFMSSGPPRESHLPFRNAWIAWPCW